MPPTAACKKIETSAEESATAELNEASESEESEGEVLTPRANRTYVHDTTCAVVRGVFREDGLEEFWPDDADDLLGGPACCFLPGIIGLTHGELRGICRDLSIPLQSKKRYTNANLGRLIQRRMNSTWQVPRQ